MHPVSSGDRPRFWVDGERLVHDDTGKGRATMRPGSGDGLPSVRPASPASSATVTAGQHAQVKLPGQRSREVTLDRGVSTDIPDKNQGQAAACPDRTQAIPCDVPAVCPIGRSTPGTCDHSRTGLDLGVRIRSPAPSSEGMSG